MSTRIRWRIGDYEIEVEGDDAFVEKQLEKFFALAVNHAGAHQGKDLPAAILARSEVHVQEDKKKELSPAEFFRSKSPKSGTENLLVLGKYLEDYRNLKEFGGKDINSLAAEAKIKDIHTQYFTTAVQQGFLRQNGPGKYSLTISGEDFVLALPASKAR